MNQKIYDEEQQEINEIQQSKVVLTKLQLFLLELLMLSPVLWVILFLWILKMPLACQLAFQLITLLGIPLISLHIQNRDLKELLRINSLKNELLWGFTLLIISLVSTFTFGYILFQNYNILNQQAIETLKENQLQLILALILLSFTNPFLEEFFWRLYLTDQYIKNCEELYSEQLKWFLASHYALYHFFVIYFFTKNFLVSLIGLTIIVIGGRIFFIVRDKIGWIATALFHMGVDLGIVIFAAYKI